MKQVLVYGNRKQDDIAWDASTPALRERAFLALFRYLDKEWEVYVDLAEPPAWDEPDTTTERKLYAAAKRGDAKAATQLLRRRKGYEYENWTLMQVERPPL